MTLDQRLDGPAPTAVASTRTFNGETGVTLIPACEHWADRVAPVLFIGMWFAGGAVFVSNVNAMAPERLAERVFGVSLMFVLWTTLLLLAGARAAWSLFGATRVAIQANELVVTRLLGNEAIARSAPIGLAAIRDVRVDERVIQMRGRRIRRWILVVDPGDGSTRRVARFHDGKDADAFLRRYVR